MGFLIKNKNDLLCTFQRFHPNLVQIKRMAGKAFIEQKEFSSEYVMSELTRGQGGMRSFYDIPIDELRNLESNLLSRLIGQDDVVRKVVSAIKRSRILQTNRKRPIASFIFAGPSGTGKTYLAHLLAEVMFKNENALIFNDLTGYKHHGDVSRFLGAPPGYAGFNEEGGLLSRLVNDRKCGISIFDEFEKADWQIIDVLMRIVDEGEFEDASNGRKISMKEFMIILTTNLGIKEASCESDPVKKENIILQAVKEYVRPEIINRFDDILVFRSLTVEDCKKICEIELKKELHNFERMYNVKISFSNQLITGIVDQAYDPEYNARPIKRTIDKVINSPLSEYALNGSIQQQSKIVLDWSDNGLKVKTK